MIKMNPVFCLLFFVVIGVSCSSLKHKRGEDTEKMVQFFEGHQKPAKQCADDKIKKRKDQEGEVALQWTVNDKGTVIKSEIMKNTYDDPSIGECFLHLLHSLKFPTHQLFTQTTINYTFHWTSMVSRNQK